MGGSQVVVEMSGDEAKLWQSYQSVISQQVKMERGLEKVSGTSRKAARQQAELARAAKRVYEQTRTPQERYNRKLKELSTLLKQNKIDQQTYGRAVGDASKKLRNAEQAGNRAFGKSALTKLGAFAAGFASVQKAIGFVTGALNDLEAKQQELAQKQLEGKGSLGKLAQLTTDPEKYKQLVATADRIYLRGGADTRAEAMDITFSLESAGALEHEELFTELKATGLIDQPAKLARATRTMIASMGKVETGTAEDIVSKAFAASAFNPSEVEPLLEAASKTGGFARAIGLSDEEVLAATALRAEATGTPEMGGTQVRSLLKGLSERGEFKGKPLMESLLSIQERNLSPDDLKKVIGGRAEAMEAFRGLLLNQERYDEVLAEVQKGQAEGRVRKQLALPELLPEVKASRLRLQSQAKRELAEWSQGVEANVADALIDELAASRFEQGQGPLRVVFEEKLDKMERKLVKLIGETDEDWVKKFAAGAPPEFQRRAREIRVSSAQTKLTELRGNTIMDPELKQAMIQELETMVDREPSTARGRPNRPGVALRAPPAPAPPERALPPVGLAAAPPLVVGGNRVPGFTAPSFGPTWGENPIAPPIVEEIQRTNEILRKQEQVGEAAARAPQEETNRLLRDTNGKLDALNTNFQAGRRAALAAPGQDPEGN